MTAVSPGTKLSFQENWSGGSVWTSETVVERGSEKWSVRMGGLPVERLAAASKDLPVMLPKRNESPAESLCVCS